MVDITDKLLKEYFENNFLVNVAFEIRFNTDLSIKNKIAEFQGSIKNEFNTYEEGHSIPISFKSNVEVSNLINYAFSNEKENLQLYLNNFTIFGLRTKNYPGYEMFSEIFLENTKKFIEVNKIGLIKRLGIRYINNIPLEKEYNKSNQLKSLYFNSFIDKKYRIENFENQRVDLKYYHNEYEIHQQFIFRKNPGNYYEVIIDLDNSLRGKINSDIIELKKKLADLHYLIKIKFFEMIKDEFLLILRKKKGD